MQTVSLRDTTELDLSDAVEVSSPGAPPARGWNGTVAVGVALVLAFGPLAFGAVETWAMFTMQTALALLLLVWIAGQLAHGSLHVRRNPLYLPMLLFGAVVLAQALWLSALPSRTKPELLNWAAYAIALFLVGNCFHSSRQLRRLMIGITVFGFAVAVFAIVQDLTWNGAIYWLRVPRQATAVFGPYVNHANYSGLMELLIPFPLLLALHGRSRRELNLFLWFASAVMIVSLLMAQSRGGFVAFVVGIAVLTVVVRRGDWRKKGLVLAGLVLLASAFAYGVDSGRLYNRFRSLEDVVRIGVLKDSPAMIQERPVLGWGLGTFPEIYPHFRSYAHHRFVNQAHNDVLQVLIETGVIGFGLAVWFVVALYRSGWHTLRFSRCRNRRTAVAAALAACTAILVHSFVDFNLRIPANAALFFAFCGLIGAAEEDD